MEQGQKDKLVISFPTTSSAIAMAHVCGEGRGRLIPIPQMMCAGCGLAWCACPELEEELMDIIRKKEIPYGAGILYRCTKAKSGGI